MPEYLAPGVYVEEVSFRSKSIEGVPTSTTGYAGMTRTGPVRYTNGPISNEPRLITSFADFERVYGGLERLSVDNGGNIEERECYVAHAVRAFFMNGGKRVYISRVFLPRLANGGVATLGVSNGGVNATWTARWPGAFGNVRIVVFPIRSGNLAFNDTDPATNFGMQAKRVRHGSIVEVINPGGAVPGLTDAPVEASLFEVKVEADGRQRFMKGGNPVAPQIDATTIIRLIELRVRVEVDNERVDVYEELALHPDQKRYLGRILQAEDPEDENAVVYLARPASNDPDANVKLLLALVAGSPGTLQGGNDGALAQPDDLAGKDANPDVASDKATGLAALGEIDDIAIVALPDGGTYDTELLCSQAADRLITHANNLRYRIAVVDGPPESSLTEIRRFRGRFDSKYAALYYPWIEILDPLERAAQGAPPRRILLPPSGFVTGIYARSDIERGVHKAPANEVVAGLTKFEMNVNKGRQDVLNPEGINALRFFEGRGNRVWGARTMSSDPEWKYVNVRRLFIYIEHS